MGGGGLWPTGEVIALYTTKHLKNHLVQAMCLNAIMVLTQILTSETMFESHDFKTSWLNKQLRKKNVKLGIPWAFCIFSFLLHGILLKLSICRQLCQKCEKLTNVTHI
jgi:hypothetical protein